jgi:hypothetical protein
MADKCPSMVEETFMSPRPSEKDLDVTRCMYRKDTSDLQARNCCRSSERIAESDKEKQGQLPEPDSVEDDTLPCVPDIPDGGTAAWLVVLGAWCVSFCSYGWINSEFSSGCIFRLEMLTN